MLVATNDPYETRQQGIQWDARGEERKRRFQEGRISIQKGREVPYGGGTQVLWKKNKFVSPRQVTKEGSLLAVTGQFPYLVFRSMEPH